MAVDILNLNKHRMICWILLILNILILSLPTSADEGIFAGVRKIKIDDNRYLAIESCFKDECDEEKELCLPENHLILVDSGKIFDFSEYIYRWNEELHVNFTRLDHNQYLKDLDYDGNPEFAVTCYYGGNSVILDVLIFSIVQNQITYYGEGKLHLELGPHVTDIVKLSTAQITATSKAEKRRELELISAEKEAEKHGKTVPYLSEKIIHFSSPVTPLDGISFEPIYSGLTKLETKPGQYLEIKQCWEHENPCRRSHCDFHRNFFNLVNGSKKTSFPHLLGDWAQNSYIYFVQIGQNKYLKDLNNDGNFEFAIAYPSSSSNPFVDTYIFSLKNNGITPYGIGRFHTEWGPHVKNITPAPHPTRKPEEPEYWANRPNVSLTVECVN
ncbi:MAG: hypothetical protein J6Y94_03040 [Bacteriovoracaceae bacterium]|nr:hypothetical protein [Bacteriovoracaceae bacterium]